MKAVQITRYGGPEVLELREVETPSAAAGQVLVKVAAAGVNPFDSKIRQGWLAGFFPLALPVTTGGDYAGEVAALGDGVQGLAVGDAVYGLLTPNQGGAYAEYVAVDATFVRAAPANLPPEEAAALPMVGQTALFALDTLGGLQAGQRVLIHGAAGGVGAMAVQIAKARGAQVYATCSGAKVERVKALGADVVIDYETADFRDVAKDIDLALDPLGGEVNRRTYDVMKRGGVILAVLRNDPDEMAQRGPLSEQYGVTVKLIAFDNEPHLLDDLRTLVEAGKVKAGVTQVFPLAEAGAAQAASFTGHSTGKIVLKVA